MRKLFTLLACLTLSGQVHAVEGLGRLFTTPEERTNLDYLRQTTKAQVLIESDSVPIDTAIVDRPSVPESVSVQGYVKRNDGKQGTIWLNRQPVRENSVNQDVAVGRLSEGSNQVPIRLNGKTIGIKAGQVYTLESDTLAETTDRRPMLKGHIDGKAPSPSSSTNAADKSEGTSTTP